MPVPPTGLHLRPCDVVGYIVSGKIEFQVEGQPKRVLSPGDAFHEPSNVRILHFDAVGGPVKFVAFYLLDRPDQELIRMLER
jgi:quercetin dioxygenase-like cupin family protein